MPRLFEPSITFVTLIISFYTRKLFYLFLLTFLLNGFNSQEVLAQNGEPELDEMTESQAVEEINHRPGIEFNRYVRSVHDFLIHTNAHRKRVHRVGLAILDKLDILIDNLPEESSETQLLLEEVGLESQAELNAVVAALKRNLPKVNRILRSHDREKILRAKKLRRYGYQGKHSFYVRLSNIYQKGSQNPGVTKKLVEELNQVGEAILDQILSSIGWKGTPKERLIRLVIQIADSLDRANDPVAAEEYGVASQMSAQEWYRRDPLRRFLVEAFLETWKQETVGMGYVRAYMMHLYKHRVRILKMNPALDLPNSSGAVELLYWCNRDAFHQAKADAGFIR